MPETTPEIWSIVELMGHVKIAGRLSEEEKFGSKMGRLDIPTVTTCSCANAEKKLIDLPTVPCDVCHGAGFIKGFITQHFGGGSVYRITYVSEDVARHVASTIKEAPVSQWDFPKRELPAPAKESLYAERDGDAFDDEDDRDRDEDGQ